MYELGTEYEGEGLVCKGDGWAREWGGGGGCPSFTCKIDLCVLSYTVLK